ncbi:PAS domain S-box protein [Halorussus halophilus]|uniref:PAS domain S-box protein n=1 Tax=Halorussus halophilus TaxID=2650975 RepID=UPI001301679C|nr:PAS domain S-box protein [Halorussus halophilus]
MGYLSRIVSAVGGRRVVFTLGGLYLAFAVGFPVVGDGAVGEILTPPVLVGASGLVLCYTGYRLPQTNVRADLYDVVGSWCVRGIGAMFGIVSFGLLAGSVDDLVSALVVLPALASVAGLGMGYHDARARNRALDAEEKQREAERYSRELERYQTIVETVNDGIFVADEDNNFTLANEAYLELVGYEREELVGSHVSLVADERTDLDEIAEEVQRHLANGVAGGKTYETTLETASGDVVDVEWTIAPLPEQEGASHDKVVVVRDVTKRNEREQRLERQNERLDSFAGMIAHELRNPVAIGQIYSQQLPTEASPEAVEYVTEAFSRIENIIEVMLVITRGQEAISENTQVRLEDAAQRAWDEVDAANATLEVTTDQTVNADKTYVQHLFRNLFENAVEHGSTSHNLSDDDVEDGKTDVTVSVGELPTGFYVADDGTGIPEEAREGVFGTGYTTAANHGGMGLGLTFVQEMATVYEWTCELTESADGGAQFEFENVTQMQKTEK